MYTHTFKNTHRRIKNVYTFAKTTDSNGKNQTMVEVSGLEPLTPCLQSRCSPS